MKTNQSYIKRMRITKNGKILVRQAGQNHFNAKASRSQQLEKRRTVKVVLNNKLISRYLPNLVNKK